MEKDDKRRVFKAAGKGKVAFEFELDEEQQKALLECIKRTGKVTLNLRSSGTSKLPGRGLLDDVDGELID
jgi:hypothetical protein